MIKFETWEKFIRLSNGSDAMKDRVVDYVVEKFGRPELLDSFLLGYSFGVLSDGFTSDEVYDFYRTIELTRDTANVPIVKIGDQEIN
jgi:hypothetical protein